MYLIGNAWLNYMRVRWGSYVLMVLLYVPLWAAKTYQPEFVNPFEESWRFCTFPELEGRSAT